MKRRLTTIAATVALMSGLCGAPALAQELSADLTEDNAMTTEQLVVTDVAAKEASKAPQPQAESMGSDDVETFVSVEPQQKAASSQEQEFDSDEVTPKQQQQQSDVEVVAAAADSTAAVIHGRAHVQNKDWVQEIVLGSNHIMLGTTGESLRVEAIEATISGASGGVVGRAHVQDEGWNPWTSSNATIGTTGKSRRIEAMRLKLTGMPDNYHLYYRVHVQNKGWLAWTRDGELAGTAGYALRLEAVELMLVRDGESAPSTEGAAYEDNGLTVRSHVQNIGWQKTLNGNSVMAGTTGQSLRMEAFSIAMPSTDVDGSICYEAHVQDEGWQTARSNGQDAGSVGMSRHVEAVRISLTGTLGSLYDLWYRVHVSNVGWLDWTKDGKDAGSTGCSLPIEALDLRLVPKGSGAPGDTAMPSLTGYTDDAKLDSYISTIIRTQTGTGSDALRKAYDYVVNNYKFKPTSPTPSSFEDWQEWSIPAAREFYERGEGDCYRFSALFCWTARRLGYDASCYIGWVKSGVSGFSVHSWVEIPIDGQVYAFDPDMQRFISSRDFFKMSYSTAPVYYYDAYQRELT